MIVEDDALLAQILGKSMDAEGLEAEIVENGLDVEERVRKFSPDLIVLDLILPGLDGFAVLEALKQEEKTKNIPVVVVSNLGDVADVKSVKALGALEHFIKANTEMETIVKFVKKVLKV